MNPARWIFYSISCFVVAATLLSLICNISLFFKITVDQSKADPVDLNFNSRDESDGCSELDKPRGCESLPEGIITKTSNLEMKSLFGPSEIRGLKSPKNLLAIAVGVKQMKTVDRIVSKFFSSGFHVMIFHYDGSLDEWRAFPWYDRAIHVSAKDQTKWWFAKRFLHPDIVSEYNFIFLWDEDLGVENFHPKRYLDIVMKEELEISQPALDPRSGFRIRHHITARQRGKDVHRVSAGRGCAANSTGPRCAGWVEIMAPVFSGAAWRCTWHMIQNDLIHAWGLDYKLGYCAQGDRTKKIGVVDAEYVVHKGILSLGMDDSRPSASDSRPSVSDSRPSASASRPSASASRLQVRKRATAELKMFEQRWREAEKKDKCWSDPFST